MRTWQLVPGGVGVALALACGGGGAVDRVASGIDVAFMRCQPDELQRVDFWQGEYPDPVVHVQRRVTVPAFTDPCLRSADTSCAIEPAVYHPWADGAGFVTLRLVEQYTATEAFTVEGTSVAKGETVEIPSYLAEGFCLWRVDGTELQATCPGVEDWPLVAVARDAPLEEVQLMDPGCGAWVEVDEALLARDGVARGTVLGYGEVGPAE